MKSIFFVTEGVTDQIVLEGLVSDWLGGEDYIPNYIQPPSSEYANDLNTPLSQGWRGVLAWCSSESPDIEASRESVIKSADLLVVHVDADVAFDADFAVEPFIGAFPPAAPARDYVKNNLLNLLGGVLPDNVVLCVPAQDLECWILCCLFPAIADDHAPIECQRSPGALLVERKYSLIRRKDNRLRKNTASYETHLPDIVNGWGNCIVGTPARCDSALEYMERIKEILNLDT